jgi:uncharacterized coiled-coil protein SlyX
MMNHTPPMSPGGPAEGLEPRVARLEVRVATLEAQMEEVLNILRRLEPKIDQLAREVAAMSRDIAKIDGLTKELTMQGKDIAKIEGRVSNLPTWWMMLVAMITTYAAGAGILVAAFRFIRP